METDWPTKYCVLTLSYSRTAPTNLDYAVHFPRLPLHLLSVAGHDREGYDRQPRTGVAHYIPILELRMQRTDTSEGLILHRELHSQLMLRVLMKSTSSHNPRC